MFSGDHIALQAVRTCQPAFSAAVIAHVEATYPDDDTRNAFCNPVPYPHEPADWLRMMLAFNKNQLQWFSDPDMMAWVDAVAAQRPAPRVRRGQRAGAREDHLRADVAAARHQRQAGNAAGAGLEPPSTGMQWPKCQATSDTVAEVRRYR